MPASVWSTTCWMTSRSTKISSGEGEVFVVFCRWCRWDVAAAVDVMFTLPFVAVNKTTKGNYCN